MEEKLSNILNRQAPTLPSQMEAINTGTITALKQKFAKDPVEVMRAMGESFSQYMKAFLDHVQNYKEIDIICGYCRESLSFRIVHN